MAFAARDMRQQFDGGHGGMGAVGAVGGMGGYGGASMNTAAVPPRFQATGIMQHQPQPQHQAQHQPQQYYPQVMQTHVQGHHVRDLLGTVINPM